MHICDQKVKNFISMGVVVDKLAKLWGEVKDMVRLVTVEVTHEGKLGLGILHFQEMIVHGYVVGENSFLVRIRFGIDTTYN